MKRVYPQAQDWVKLSIEQQCLVEMLIMWPELGVVNRDTKVYVPLVTLHRN